MTLLFFALLNFSLAAEIKPPVAEQKKFTLEKFGDVRQDEYYWMKERTNPKVIQYLKAENVYLKKSLDKNQKLQKDLFREMKARIKEDESSYPLKDGAFYYYTRFEKGQQYPVFARSQEIKGPEEILFNVNLLAKKHSYYSASYEMSPDHKTAALIFDTVGRRFYNIKFKNLSTGKFLKDEIKNVTNNAVWAEDNKSLFYSRQDPDTLRWYQIYRYDLDTHKSHLVFEEKQDTFDVAVSGSLSKKHIFINSYSTLSNEVLSIPAATPASAPVMLLAREREHEFSITEDEDSYYVVTNKNAKDYKVMKIAFTDAEKGIDLNKAQTWLAHRPGTHIDNFIVFKDYAVVSTHENGQTQIELVNKKTSKISKLAFSDQAYTAELGANAEYTQNFVRLSYSSLRRPNTTYDCDMTTQKLEMRKEKEVPNYNPELYASERIFVKASDGRQVPVSILKKKDTALDGKAPILIYGYGAYGVQDDPWFNPGIFSLIDRGYIFALAHIRGGGEMGRYWVDEGRTLNKKNTFFDFIDVTEYLVQQKYAHPKKVFAMGGSAGGLLMGAVANYRPDLYKGIIAQVPFVDALTTMLDETIPLTTAEYDEWGNPNEKKYYDYIKSYSPYDNVSAQAYPNLLIETGLHDSQVQYWEPAKWTARLRRLNTSKNFIFLKTDMTSGHGGKSGRFDQLEDEALEYAFILEMENK